MENADEPSGHGLCGAKARGGSTCKHSAGWGTNHVGVGRCKLHGGSTPSHRNAASRDLARQECARLSVPIEASPDEALLGELYRTLGWVHTYNAAVQELPLHPEPAKRTVVEGGERDGAVEWEPGKPGIYGPTYHVSGIPTGEAKPHVLVELLHRERRHLADVSTAALRANIDERRVRIVEEQAELVHRAFEAALEVAHLTVEQRQEARQEYGRHLRLAS